MEIDISFDFRSDFKGKDPDNWSPTLRAYQRSLYSKRLPNGEVMELDENLAWKNYQFNSDRIPHGYTYWESSILVHLGERVDCAYKGRYLMFSARVSQRRTADQADL